MTLSFEEKCMKINSIQSKLEESMSSIVDADIFRKFSAEVYRDLSNLKIQILMLPKTKGIKVKRNWGRMGKYSAD